MNNYFGQVLDSQTEKYTPRWVRTLAVKYLLQEFRSNPADEVTATLLDLLARRPVAEQLREYLAREAELLALPHEELEAMVDSGSAGDRTPEELVDWVMSANDSTMCLRDNLWCALGALR